MQLTSLAVQSAWRITPVLHVDNRGIFSEWFRREIILESIGLDFDVQQVNVSKSGLGVIRGLHYSLASGGQAKLIRCISGSILDVVVDIRLGSPTYGEWCSELLTADNGISILVGPHLAHGFLALEPDTIVSYLLSSSYSPQNELEIDAFDPELGIDWKRKQAPDLRSTKDSNAPTLEARKSLSQLPQFENS